MKVLLYHLDGALPNIALMRVAAHHRKIGDSVELRRGRVYRTLEDQDDDLLVYGSLIFEKTRPVAEALRREFPQAVLGGTGWSVEGSLEEVLVTTLEQDYTLYPEFRHSIGFSQRGCRLKCKFCVVPRKEGEISTERSIYEIWRGDPWPREVILLDNDFFGASGWRERICEIREGRFKVCFSQGINARFLDDETAAAIASVNYQNNAFTEKRLFDGLESLKRAGVRPDDIMVYMLIGYWPGETHEERDYRRQKLREFGCRPYPMPFVRTPELVGYQRWVVGAYDKPRNRNYVPWEKWRKASWNPRKVSGVPVLHILGQEVPGIAPPSRS